MAVRLRPHHLLCFLTYAGRGYTPAFTRTMDDLAQRIAAGEPVELVDGPDDACASLLADQPGAHCLTPSVAGRDAAAARSLEPLLGPLPPGRVFLLDSEGLDRMRAAFAGGGVRAACAGCEWKPLCDGLAADGFRGTRLNRRSD